MADLEDRAESSEDAGSRTGYPKVPEGCVILAVLSEQGYVINKIVAPSLDIPVPPPGHRAEIDDPEIHPPINCPVVAGLGWRERYARFLQERAAQEGGTSAT